MAVGMLLAGPLVTRDVYEQVTEKMFGNYPMRADQSPEGLILHTAGETPEGFYIYDIWESKEQFERFNDTRIGPAMQEIFAGAQPDGPMPEPQYYSVDVLVSPA